MARGNNQKLKLLYILDILQKKTNGEHGITTAELIKELEHYDVNAERKSIYSDIEELRRFGYEIESSKEKVNGGYRLISRTFELPELKLLVDAVQAAKFITQKKSRELIKKLTGLASNYDAKQLSRQVYVSDRIKTENESIYYNVDYLHRAIQEDLQISFDYYFWNVEKELQKKKGADSYIVSPHILMWNDENYYLIAYDEKEQMIKHFRVDKMGSISLLENQRTDVNQFLDIESVKYSNKTFGMFRGREETVTVIFPNHLAGVVIDRFGKEVDMRKRSEEDFSARLKVAVSGQFFGWLTGLGAGVVIDKPEEVRSEYGEYLSMLLRQYEN